MFCYSNNLIGIFSIPFLHDISAILFCSFRYCCIRPYAVPEYMCPVGGTYEHPLFLKQLLVKEIQRVGYIDGLKLIPEHSYALFISACTRNIHNLNYRPGGSY